MNLLLIGLWCIMAGIIGIMTGITTFSFIIGGFCLGVGVMNVCMGVLKIFDGD